MARPTRARRKQELELDLSVRGSTGLPVYGGRVYDEILDELAGDRGRRIFREMSEQDPIVGGVLLGIEMLSRQVAWKMKPADDTDEAKAIADFVDECLTDMTPSWENTLSEILSMLVYGWSWMEIIYKRREGLKLNDNLHSSRFDDGKVGWAGWSIRSQESLDHWMYSDPDNEEGEIRAMVQMAPPKFKTNVIPRAKSLHFTTRSRRENPEGISILRNSYRAWFMKKNIEAIEGIGIERDLAGLPVLWAPARLLSKNANAEEKALLAHLQTIVTSIKRDEQEGIIMPLSYDENQNEQYKLELLSTGGDRQFDTNAIISRYDERIAMSMLADFILMGHQAVGSYALSTTKTGLFSTALGAILDLMSAEINQQAIPRLIRLNGKPLKLTPSLQHGQIEAADMGKLGAYLKALADSGMPLWPDSALHKYVLEQAGLPSDPGAGEYPLPGEGEEGADGQLPLPAPLPTTKPPQPALGPGAKPKPATRQPARASEGRQGRRFVPLPNRIVKVRASLRELLPSDEYTALLSAAMDAGKFTSLSKTHQEAILQAESRLEED